MLPPAGPLLLVIIGVVVWRRRPRLARGLIIAGVASLWIMSTPVFSDALARMSERYPAASPAQLTNTQAIVILGGGGQRPWASEYGGPEPEPYLLERLAYGAFLSRRTGLPVLVSGNGVEAEAMRQGLQRHFDINARWVDDRSYDTFENARNSAAMLKASGIARIALVTRGSHMYRSAQEFRATGLDVVPAPVGVWSERDRAPFRWLPNPEALNRSYQATYELIGEPVRRLLFLTHLRRQQ